jgi:hypothetical protein
MQIVIAHPDLVPGLRVVYEQGRRRLSLGYDELMTLFQDSDTTLVAIARRLEMSHQNISLLYHRYFYPALQRVFGVHRPCGQRVTLAERFANLPADTPIVRLATLVRQAGIHAEPVPGMKSACIPRKSALAVAGVLCSVHKASGLYKRRNQDCYRWHFKLTDELFGAHLFWATDSPHRDRIFVLTDAALRSMVVPGRKTSIYVPTSLAARARSKWWGYENAWPSLLVKAS